jgi:hypothetical protein
MPILQTQAASAKKKADLVLQALRCFENRNDDQRQRDRSRSADHSSTLNPGVGLGN